MLLEGVFFKEEFALSESKFFPYRKASCEEVGKFRSVDFHNSASYYGDASEIAR